MCQKNLEWCRKWCNYRSGGESGYVSGGADGYFIDWCCNFSTFLFHRVPGVFRCGLFLGEVFRNVVDADAELVTVCIISVYDLFPLGVVVCVILIL